MDWINKALYPFRSNFLNLDNAHIHYIDEGRGDTILFVHGTPEWSFGYRDLIKPLSKKFRCIAFDHLGFGLSDKPSNGTYTVKDHAVRLEKFISILGLNNIHIVANDFGGSMALYYAIHHPENVSRICLFNTWMWSLQHDKHYTRPGKLIQTPLGEILYKRFNFPVNVLLPQAFGDKSKLTKEMRFHYKKPLTHGNRSGTYAFAKELLNAGPWWDSLWEQMDKIDDKPFLICWGLKDRLILPKELDRWMEKIPGAKIIRFEKAGHFLQEEEPEKLAKAIEDFFFSN